MSTTWQRIAEAKTNLDPRLCPEVAIVLGSGLGAFATRFTDAQNIDYHDVPHMPSSTVSGHHGRFVTGKVRGKRVVAMQGRVHLYEGHDVSEVVFGVRLMHALGAKVLIVTNAAGGLDPAYNPSDLMLIEDHLNLTGRNPLATEDLQGERFVDMSNAYDLPLRKTCINLAEALDVTLHQGVYAGVLGPSYETPSEIRMLRTMGADAVGMSTVLEVIAARHLSMRVVGISCITNLAAGLMTQTLNHGDVKAQANRAEASFTTLIEALIEAAF